MARLGVVLLFVGPRGAPAQPAGEKGLRPIWTFTTAQLGGRAQCMAAAEDARGVVYVGGLAGLVEHDGVRWRVLAVPNDSAVRAVAALGPGQVAVGARDEMGIVSEDATGALRFTSLLPLLPPQERVVGDVLAAHPVPNGAAFVTPRKLHLWTHGALRSLAGTFHASFLVEGRLLVATPEGLRQLGDDGLELAGDGEVFAGRRVEAVLPRPDGTRLVCVAGEGLFVWDGHEARPLAGDASGALRAAGVLHATALPDGRFAFATAQAGVVVVTASGLVDERIDEAAGLPDNRAAHVLTARDGALWVATMGGLARVEATSPVTLLDRRLGLQGKPTTFQRHGADLYVGSSQGLFVLEPRPAGAAFPSLRRVPEVAGPVWRLESWDGELWAGTSKGIWVGRGARWTRVPGTEDLVAYDLARTPAQPGIVYAGLRSGIAALRMKPAPALLGRLAGVDEMARALATGPDGELWANTVSRGALRIDLGAEPLAVHRRALFTEAGLEPGLERIGGAAVILGDTGVFTLEPGPPPGTGVRRLVPHPLGAVLPPGQQLFAASEDRLGNVWMNTTPASVASPKAGGGYAFRFLWSVPGSDIQAVLADGSVVWLATEAALVRFDPRAERPPPPSAPPLLRAVVAEPSRSALPLTGGTPRLSRPDRRLRFEIAAAPHASPVRYQVRLDGEDADWGEPRDAATAAYANLWEGRYVFRARIVDAAGQPGPEIRYPFTVAPPLARTPAALALALLGLAAATLAAFRWRDRALRARAGALEALVADRTRDLEAARTDLEAANRKLRDAQDRVGRLLSTSRDAATDLQSWCRTTAEELTRAVGARAIGTWEVVIGSGGPALRPLADFGLAPPTITELREPGSTPRDGVSRSRLVFAAGSSREPAAGAVVVEGPITAFGEIERRLLVSFVHQLSAALETRRLRRELAEAEERRAASERELEAQGVPTLRICPACERCFPSTQARCPDDTRPLQHAHGLPFVLFDRYRFERRIGQGGMGLVLAARDERLGRDVAIKLIRPERMFGPSERARLEREARLVARIQHPGVIALHDVGELADGTAILVMERLVGLDLRTMLDHYGPGSFADVAALARQGSAALAAAHRAGVVHRDVKPENVFLTDAAPGFRVKLLDFGVAKGSLLEAGLTQAGALVGTPRYMAPEQVRGESADPRTDLYAFAAVLFEALTGRAVADELDVTRLLAQVTSQVSPRVTQLVPEAPPGLDELFHRALAKSRDTRPDNVESWGRDVARLLDQAPAGTRLAWPLVSSAPPRAGAETIDARQTPEAGAAGGGDDGVSNRG